MSVLVAILAYALINSLQRILAYALINSLQRILSLWMVHRSCRRGGLCDGQHFWLHSEITLTSVRQEQLCTVGH